MVSPGGSRRAIASSSCPEHWSRTTGTRGAQEVRARDLQAAFADPGIDAIQTMRGGYGSAQVIPLLDFEAIAETPKFFVGLSDITALHAALLVHTGLGDVLRAEPDDGRQPFTFAAHARSFPAGTRRRDDQAGAGRPGPSDGGCRSPAGRASGRLVGGCLGDFIYTIGTPWEPDVDGTIFFFEEVGTRRSSRPGVALPRSDGKFEGVRGIVVGELQDVSGTSHLGPANEDIEDVLGPPRRAGHPGAVRYRWDTAPACRAFRLGSKRRSTRMRSRSRSMSRHCEHPDGARPARRSAAALDPPGA